jgi:hypothetical protein
VSTAHGALYTAAWVALCALAAALTARSPRAETLLSRGYRRLLLAPWRLATGALATLFLAAAAPYANDPTWDRPVGLFMGVLTYVTAPWSVGALVRALRGQLPRRHLVVAACAWLFSASWSYDLYNFVRLGAYPASWAANLAASSVLYALGGLCWSLVHRPPTGVTFGFLHEGWPAPPDGDDGRRTALPALVFVGFVAALLLPFVLDAVPGLQGVAPWARW